MAPMDHHFLQSSYREKTLEHIFIGECLKALWRRQIYDVEILRSEVDAAGYDIVFELRGIVRHIQLKTSHATAKTAKQNLSRRLMEKPSGCVVWAVFDAHTLALGPFLWYGSEPGKPLADLSYFPKAKHTKGNRLGIKMEKQNSYSVPRQKFLQDRHDRRIVGPPVRRRNHILNTPNLVSSIGALAHTANASPKTSRVSDGKMMPSSQSRAVA
jgi:hypothetical protein